MQPFDIFTVFACLTSLVGAAQSDYPYNNALTDALKEEDTGRIKALLATTDQVNFAYDQTKSGLVFAIQRGYVPAVKMMLEAGADANPVAEYDYPAPISVAFMAYFRSLTNAFVAPPEDYLAIIEALLEAGASVNQRPSLIGMALEKRNAGLVKLLVYYGLEIDGPCCRGRTILENVLSIFPDDLPLIAYLLSINATAYDIDEQQQELVARAQKYLQTV